MNGLETPYTRMAKAYLDLIKKSRTPRVLSKTLQITLRGSEYEVAAGIVRIYEKIGNIVDDHEVVESQIITILGADSYLEQLAEVRHNQAAAEIITAVLSRAGYGGIEAETVLQILNNGCF